MENKHPISEILEASLENLKKLVDVNTIIGEAITTDGVTIIPVSKVSFGFATGGSELPTSKPSTPFGG
ncbi:MAG: spore germination protein GerW family protein, partial [Oscillospiraceae bacterium]